MEHHITSSSKTIPRLNLMIFFFSVLGVSVSDKYWPLSVFLKMTCLIKLDNGFEIQRVTFTSLTLGSISNYCSLCLHSNIQIKYFLIPHTVITDKHPSFYMFHWCWWNWCCWLQIYKDPVCSFNCHRICLNFYVNVTYTSSDLSVGTLKTCSQVGIHAKANGFVVEITVWYAWLSELAETVISLIDVDNFLLNIRNTI